ncbi:hypothetical protein HAX54_032579 [Datura stramonium]|uniref:Uncharacterized protein n=1 Tax=Datura stramonium TaxID=4076 RepID=A0ABS8VAY9_DATST|nr:hypothetical protein [Datura stramonium]
MIEESNNAYISPNHDNQNHSTESKRSKTRFQQSKCSQQSKHDTNVNVQNLNVPTTEQLQNAQVDTSERNGEGVKRGIPAMLDESNDPPDPVFAVCNLNTSG